MLEKSLATLFALLILATLINHFLVWRLPERKEDEVTLRIRTWWSIVICFSLVISGPRWMTLTFFALISFLALKEYCTLISVHFPRWLYWVIPLNYLFIGFNCFELYLLFIPLAGFLILATGQVFVGGGLRFSAYRERHFLGLDNDRFRLESCRLVINVANHKYPGRGVTGVISFGINRVKRYCTVFMGKILRQKKSGPQSQPGKNAGRSGGGRHHHHDCVTDYWTVADTAKYITGIISGFVNWY
ncbi:putative phosphatidate cytidylyltransferase [Escherichia coli]|nr:putative phosphatidate cytidylyltransferase [Escherichia coli]